MIPVAGTLKSFVFTDHFQSKESRVDSRKNKFATKTQVKKFTLPRAVFLLEESCAAKISFRFADRLVHKELSQVAHPIGYSSTMEKTCNNTETPGNHCE